MDTVSRLLVTKLNICRSILQKASLANLYSGAGLVELQVIEVRFALITGRLFLQNSLVCAQELARVISTEDLSGRIDRILDACEAQILAAGVAVRKQSDAADTRKKSRGRLCPDIQRLFDMYMPGLAAAAAPKINYSICSNCSIEMIVDSGRSELQCATCGAIRELIGTVFEDSQFYSQEGQKAKSGTFNPNRHLQFWWQHIQAKEPEEEIGDRSDPQNLYGEKLIERLRAIIVRDRHILQLLTVNDIRMMLQELGKTNLNKNVPLILYKLTGVGPPDITDLIAVRTENLFSKALEMSEVVRQRSRTEGNPSVPEFLGMNDMFESGSEMGVSSLKIRVNRNYYPYYIYKILDQIIPEDDFEQRRILFYIYIQSQDTVEADDDNWELICREIPELKYIPTDRTKALQYMF